MSARDRLIQVATMSDATLERLRSDMIAETRLIEDALLKASDNDQAAADSRIMDALRAPPEHLAKMARIASLHAAEGRQPTRGDYAARLVCAVAAGLAATVEMERRARPQVK